MNALVITNTITRRDSRAVEKYMTEVARYDTLTAEQEVALFNAYHNGDENAFTQIINCNLRFVISVAKQYQHCGFSLLDLINEGNIGLIKAAKRFDVTKGFKFISYAVWWIRQSIIQAINEKARKIRLPLNFQSSIRSVIKSRDVLTQTLERAPSHAEIAKHCGLSVSKVEKFLQSYSKCSSLDAPIQDGEDVTMGQFMEDDNTPAPDENLTEKESLQTEVRMMLHKLNDRDARIISMYFGIGGERPMAITEIGEHMGISKERIRQLKHRALRRLYRNIQSKAV